MSSNGKKPAPKATEKPFQKVFDALVRRGEAKRRERMPLMLLAGFTPETLVTEEQVKKALKTLRKTPV